MAIDRLWIFNRVQFHLKNETNFFTSTPLINLVSVDAWIKIAGDVGYPRTALSTTVTQGQFQVAAPSNFLRLDDCKDFEFRKDNGIDSMPEVPDNYYLDNNNMIGFYPPAIKAGTVKIPYVMTPTSLSSDTSTNELTDKCADAAIYYIASECMLRANDPKHEIYVAKYDKEIERLKRIYGTKYEKFGEMQARETKIRGTN